MEPTIAWMIAGGARMDDREPDPDHLAHLAALRDAARQARAATSAFARIAGALGFQPTRAVDPMTTCCAAA